VSDSTQKMIDYNQNKIINLAPSHKKPTHKIKENDTTTTKNKYR
jgi:hypothetical protein